MSGGQAKSQRVGHLAPPHADDGTLSDIAKVDIATDLGLKFGHEKEGVQESNPTEHGDDEGGDDQHAVRAQDVVVTGGVVVRHHGIVAVGIAVVIGVAGRLDDPTAVISGDRCENKTGRCE